MSVKFSIECFSNSGGQVCADFKVKNNEICDIRTFDFFFNYKSTYDLSVARNLFQKAELRKQFVEAGAEGLFYNVTKLIDISNIIITILVNRES